MCKASTFETRFRASVLITLVLALAALTPWSCQAAPERIKLTILHTNDVHGHLFPFDYSALGQQEYQVGGAARRATLIRQIRQTAGNPVLVMDAGDVFTRGPLEDLHGVPDFDVMNAVPYDAMTLGNNEFEGAPEAAQAQQILRDRIAQAKFPVLSANVFDATSGQTLAQPYKVFEIDGVRIGVFGLTAPRVGEYPQAKGLTLSDPIAVAKKTVESLRKQCDFVVALTHIGYPMDLMLAASVKGIDVVIGGDSHTWVFRPTPVSSRRTGAPEWWIGSTIVCQDGEWGKCLGRLDLALRRAGDGSYLVERYSGKLIDVTSSAKPAADIDTVLKRYAASYSTAIGTLASPVPVSQAAAWVAQRMKDAAGADVAVEPTDSVAAGLRSGKITELDVRSMFPFVNQVVRVKATGGQIRAFMSWKKSGTAGAYVKDDVLYVGREKAAGNKLYTLAVEDYYAQTSPALAGLNYEPLGRSTRQLIIGYLREGHH